MNRRAYIRSHLPYRKSIYYYLYLPYRWTQGQGYNHPIHRVRTMSAYYIVNRRANHYYIALSTLYIHELLYCSIYSSSYCSYSIEVQYYKFKVIHVHSLLSLQVHSNNSPYNALQQIIPKQSLQVHSDSNFPIQRTPTNHPQTVHPPPHPLQQITRKQSTLRPILDTLQGLLSKFTEEQANVKQELTNSKHAYNMMQEGSAGEIKSLNAEIKNLNLQKGEQRSVAGKANDNAAATRKNGVWWGRRMTTLRLRVRMNR